MIIRKSVILIIYTEKKEKKRIGESIFVKYCTLTQTNYIIWFNNRLHYKDSTYNDFFWGEVI